MRCEFLIYATVDVQNGFANIAVHSAKVNDPYVVLPYYLT